MNEDWKLDMLKQLWAGKETDPDKLQSDSKSIQKSKANTSSFTSVDLHRFQELSQQLAETEKAIDLAIQKNFSGIIIIHGKGEGILKSQIIKILKTHRYIAEYKSIQDYQKESGAVKVRFK
ncbi:MAG: Smr/MutS family protein [Chitinophagales bacterium]